MNETMAPDKPGNNHQSIIDLAEFLENYPPGSKAIVRGSDPEIGSIIYEGFTRRILERNIHLFCSSVQCDKVTIFRPAGKQWRDTEWRYSFLQYVCQDCEKSSRIYAFATHDSADRENVQVNKIGEWPLFAPRLPARVMSLVGSERDLFLKGRRAENQDLGVGAFAYYRRVVDSQW